MNLQKKNQTICKSLVDIRCFNLLLLSGGFDSSLLSSIYNSSNSGKINTFSLVFQTKCTANGMNLMYQIVL